jgi:ubiquinone/menaquinone biosynthesis C-methylase UbiE
MTSSPPQRPSNRPRSVADASGADGAHEQEHGGTSANRRYYDAFAGNYEAQRGRRSRGGYHDLVDELEAEFVRRFATGKDVLEVGCGTGLVLSRIARFARCARGVDLSPRMLDLAREKQLDVQLASATDLPFEDDTFDVSCSFKVLAHIRDIEQALSEMTRVVRPGGYVIAEFYNPWSLRALIKRLGPARRIAQGVDEGHVFTRYDSPASAGRLLPAHCRKVAARGVRILLPSAQLMRVPLLDRAFWLAERRLCDTALGNFGGFWIGAFQKQPR